MGTWPRAVSLGLLAALVLAPLGAFLWQMVGTEQSPDQVTISVDGVRWSGDLEDEFFHSEATWGPGEERTAILSVRNEAEQRADVSVDVVCTAGQELISTGVLRVSAKVNDRAEQVVAPHSVLLVVDVGVLGPGETATLTLRAEHTGAVPEPVDSTSVRHHVAGQGKRVGEPPSVLTANGAYLVLAPVFLGIAMVVTALVMMSSRRSGPGASDRE